MLRSKFTPFLFVCCLGTWSCEHGGHSSSHDLPEQPQIGEPATQERLTATDEERGTQKATGDKLCLPCASSRDCGGSPNLCLRRNDGVMFCGQDCRSTACPSGYTCTRLSSTISQCVPPQADCSRVPRDAGTTDAGPSDAGVRDAGPMDAGGTADAGTVPATAHCAPAANWSAAWSSYEDEVLRLANQYRAAGATCGTTSYGPAAALSVNPALRCAARLHAKDMQDRNYFSHTTPDGVTFDQRITQAGYDWRTIGENIAYGQRSPQEVMTAWMQSPGHCQNLMNPSFKELGVGFYDNYRWVQDFGARF